MPERVASGLPVAQRRGKFDRLFGQLAEGTWKVTQAEIHAVDAWTATCDPACHHMQLFAGAARERFRHRKIPCAIRIVGRDVFVEVKRRQNDDRSET